MAKINLTIEVADDNILGLIAKYEKARREASNAWAELMNCFTAQYGDIYKNEAKIREMPCAEAQGKGKKRD